MRLIAAILTCLLSFTAEARNPRGSVNGITAPVTGVWTNVTPSGVNLSTGVGSCSNYGTETVYADTANPGTLYTQFNCVGIYKSTDYGQTWSGPVNTGTNGSTVANCQGGISVNPNATLDGAATIYESCIQGTAQGFWISTDNGVDWTNYNVAPLPSGRQDCYPPQIDPYNRNHLLMAGHEQDYVVESFNAGTSWSNVSLNSGMLESGGTGAIFFIDTGSDTGTSTTFLWMGQQDGGVYGTWRTTNDGTSWTQVDTGEHGHGTEQIYQAGSGVIYVPQAYSALGWGLLRSTDYGATYSHVGATNNIVAAWGTGNAIYAMNGFPIGYGSCNTPSFEAAAYPGTGSYTQLSTPSGMCQGSGWVATVTTGGYNVFIGAMWNNGLWRYVEP